MGKKRKSHNGRTSMGGWGGVRSNAEEHGGTAPACSSSWSSDVCSVDAAEETAEKMLADGVSSPPKRAKGGRTHPRENSSLTNSTRHYKIWEQGASADPSYAPDGPVWPPRQPARPIFCQPASYRSAHAADAPERCAGRGAIRHCCGHVWPGAQEGRSISAPCDRAAERMPR